MKKFFVCILICLSTVGCATYQQEGPSFSFDIHDPAEEFLHYMHLTVPTAKTVLEEFNSSAASSKLGGPFQIEDYRARVVDHSQPERVRVLYHIKRPVTFVVFPHHFEILLNNTTGETRAVKGR